MNPNLFYLFGKLTSTVDSIKIEADHLAEEYEDVHKRLVLLIDKLKDVVNDMGSTELSPFPSAQAQG